MVRRYEFEMKPESHRTITLETSPCTVHNASALASPCPAECYLSKQLKEFMYPLAIAVAVAVFAAPDWYSVVKHGSEAKDVPYDKRGV